jgi:hypothetical protein
MSMSSVVWGEWRSGVEIEVVRVEEGPEKLNALRNLEEREARFSTRARGGVKTGSGVDFPSGEGTRGVCVSFCEGMEEWVEGMEECVEAVSSCEGAEAADVFELVEEVFLWRRCGGVNSGEEDARLRWSGRTCGGRGRSFRGSEEFRR